MGNKRHSIYLSGSAFHRHRLNSNRPLTRLKDRDKTNYVSLTEWCRKNFISSKIGYGLIGKHLLIGQRLYGRWWVCANLDCLPELLDYLGLEELFFDASNQA